MRARMKRLEKFNTSKNVFYHIAVTYAKIQFAYANN